MNVINKKTGLTDYFQYQEIIIYGSKYLIGVRKFTEIREVLLTNLIDYYLEVLPKPDIIKRCQDLNPILNNSTFEELVDYILANIPKYIILSSYDKLHLKTKLEDGFFFFNIYLSKINPQQYYISFNQSFYATFLELYNRYKYLLNIVNKKQTNLKEHKSEEELVDELFVENLFYTNFKNMRSADKISIHLDIMNFYDSIQKLKFSKLSSEFTIDSSSTINNKLKSTMGNNEKIHKIKANNNLRCVKSSKIKKKLKNHKRNAKSKFL